ncbi:hypothetical protein O181_101572 [Austropuccinia psidii MF-1]|uniref:Integrase catalytic domain-containing protein n=1 Tax=Austropuccinia psidii MF-1 TaxID=1389203 RepID=A0A9Q3JHG8_9BASI|nr:hypothetical protein [Austropuccinia psidii MF-1]
MLVLCFESQADIGRESAADLVDSEGKIIFKGAFINNTVALTLTKPGVRKVVLQDTLTIHRSLGHLSNKYASKSFPSVNFSKLQCDVCVKANIHWIPFKGDFPEPVSILEMVHMDLCGSITPKSIGGNAYIFQIIDGYSRFRFVYCLENKAQCFEVFQRLQSFAEKQNGFKIKIVVSDNGGEFVSKFFQEYLSANGIQQLLTSPYTPQQNPFAERENRNLLERVRFLLSDSWLDYSWWGEAAATAAYLLNQTPVSSQDFKTPYERFYNKNSELRVIHPFGSRVFINKERKKLTPNLSSCAENGIFVGYTKGHKNFKVYNLETDDPEPEEFVNDFQDEVVTVVEPVSVDCVSVHSVDNAQDMYPLIDEVEELKCSLEKAFPKGWTMELVPDIAPKNISSSIDKKNIINHRRRQPRNVVNLVAAGSDVPITYLQPIRHEKGNA